MTGLVALISLMGSGPVSLAMAQAPERAAMIRVTDAYESAPLTVVWMLVMVVGFSLGPVVLGFGLWRSGFPWRFRCCSRGLSCRCWTPVGGRWLSVTP